MTDAAATEVAVLRRRLIIMAATVGVCAVVALGSIVGNLAFHVTWMLWTFALALLVGFGAQIWMIVGFVRQGRAVGGRAVDKSPGDRTP